MAVERRYDSPEFGGYLGNVGKVRVSGLSKSFGGTPVLHDIDLAHRHFGWSMLLAHESVACGPTGDVLTHDNLHRARHLCDACAADRNFWAAA